MAEYGENDPKQGKEYGAQTAGRMSVRPLQKQSTASAAPKKPGHHVAGGRLATTVHADHAITGTKRGGPAFVRAGSTKSGSSAPRRVKVKRHYREER